VRGHPVEAGATARPYENNKVRYAVHGSEVKIASEGRQRSVHESFRVMRRHSLSRYDNVRRRFEYSDSKAITLG
jgi:hypothetical protein